jgi:hypothetical protein
VLPPLEATNAIVSPTPKLMVSENEPEGPAESRLPANGIAKLEDCPPDKLLAAPLGEMVAATA